MELANGHNSACHHDLWDTPCVYDNAPDNSILNKATIGLFYLVYYLGYR